MCHNRKHTFFALIFLLLCCTACGVENAASILLARTEGSVKITNKGKDISPSEGLKLYNGYEVKTESAAYAWMELDASRLAKMDSESQVQIQKEGKHLDILVSQGSLFFNIEEPLKEDETLNIHTSSMIVGIRGTCGWIAVENPEHIKVYLLEGTVTCRIDEEDAVDTDDVLISAWQMAEMQLKNGKGTITVHEFTSLDIPDFVTEELEKPSWDPDIEPLNNADRSAVLTMPVTAQEIQDLWNDGTKNVTILPGEGNNVLTIDTNFKDSSGDLLFVENYGLLSFPDCTLTLEEGVDLMIEDDITFSSQGGFTAKGNVTIRGLLSASGTTVISGVIRILPSDGHTDMPDSNDNYGQLMASGNFTATQEIISECYFAPVQNATADALICGEHGYFFNAGDLTGNITFDTGSSLSSSLGDTIHGTVTINRGIVNLGGNIDHIVVNGGEAYINAGEVPLITDSLTVNGGTVHILKVLPDTSLGSVSVNGGELIEHNDNEAFDTSL